MFAERHVALDNFNFCKHWAWCSSAFLKERTCFMFSVFRSHRLIPNFFFWVHGRGTRTAYLKQGPRIHAEILGTRRVTWDQSHTENPQVLSATVPNSVIRANLLRGFVHPCPQVLHIVFGDVSFRPRSVVGVKIVFLFSKRKTVPSQASRREYPFSSTDLIHVCTALYTNNNIECPGTRLQIIFVQLEWRDWYHPYPSICFASQVQIPHFKLITCLIFTAQGF